MNYLNYGIIEKEFPWIFEKQQQAIISPDVDGILCGLLMSNYLEWEIVGFYDGKMLCQTKNISIKDCIFLDIEIFRKEIRSCGHHMLLYNKNEVPDNWGNFNKSINPNNLRNFDALHNFQKKYPLATIHFLLCCLKEILNKEIKFLNTTTVPLLYVDGTFKNLLNYPENCNEWLMFLKAKKQDSPIYPIFEIFSRQKLKDIIHLLQSIFEKFDNIKINKRRGDKILLEKINNIPLSFQKYYPLFELLGEYTGWEFKKEKWNLEEFKIIKLEKKIENSLTGKNFIEIIEKNPISWAITANKRMEYTLGNFG
ncbi:MAG TPA: hypothetical protein PLW95_06625 [bacterium]|nr:hypothetical protein [bacterium]